MRVPQTKKHSLLKTLMLGIIGICAIAVIVLSIYGILQSPSYVRHSLGKETQSYAKTASGILSERLEFCCSALSDLARNDSLHAYLKSKNFFATPELYQILMKGSQAFDTGTTLHLLSPERMQAISLGYNNNAFAPGDYAGMEEILASASDTVIIPKHFVNTAGENVAMVLVCKINEEGHLLGYLCLDISNDSISHWLSSSETLSGYRIAPYAEIFVTTWYRQFVYQNSSLKSIASKNGKYTVSPAFSSMYEQSSGKSFSYSDNGHDYQISAVDINDGRFWVIAAIPVDFFLKEGSLRLIPLIVICLLIAGIGCFVSLKIYREILLPIDNIVATLQKVDRGDMSARCTFETRNELALVRDSMNQMITDIDRTMKNNQEKQRLLALAENNMLKAQIKPHFINNVLESIYWMLKLNRVEDAEQAVMSFSKLISTRMQLNVSPTEPFSDSLDLTKHYLKLQQLCYPDKYDTRLQIDEAALTVPVPFFMLQPLVENALLHGLQPKVGKGVITITATVIERVFCLVVSDDGVGMDEESIQKAMTDKADKHGIALSNIRRRLELIYGEEASFMISSLVGKGTDVTIRIPVKEEEAHVLAHGC